MRKWTWITLITVSLGLVVGAWSKQLPIGLTEALGFVTGAICVLLIVEENIWNFPIGIANNIFFIILFISAGLYGDMGLQVIYIALAFHGWYEWLRGGTNRTSLRISRASIRMWMLLIPVGVVSTWMLTLYLTRINDTAPFLDALTTVLSLIAQYLLNLKRIENWWIWITADVIYIGLYMYKGLYLTSILYAIFILMCIAGLRAWHRSLVIAKASLPPTPIEGVS
ncbi:MAG: nicotinamide riboside transporter PnuC [Armatimonadota bacterium]